MKQQNNLFPRAANYIWPANRISAISIPAIFDPVVFAINFCPSVLPNSLNVLKLSFLLEVCGEYS